MTGLRHTESKHKEKSGSSTSPDKSNYQDVITNIIQAGVSGGDHMKVQMLREN